jgi:hypothetical protein
MLKSSEAMNNDIAVFRKILDEERRAFVRLTLFILGLAVVLGLIAYVTESGLVWVLAGSIAFVGIGVFITLWVRTNFTHGPLLKILIENPQAVERIWISEITQIVNGVKLNRRQEVRVQTPKKTFSLLTAAVWSKLGGDASDEPTRKAVEVLLRLAPNAVLGVPDAKAPPPADAEANLPLDFFEALQGCTKRIHVEGRPIEIKVPALVEDGVKLRLKDEGKPGDLYLTIEVAPHPQFQRKGVDIFTTVLVSAKMAQEGGEVIVPTIYNDVRLKVQPESQPGVHYRLKEMGALDPRTGLKGSQYVIVNVGS